MEHIKKKLLVYIVILSMLAPMQAAAYDDYNAREVGVDAVKYYSPCGLGNVYNTVANTAGFYNYLGSKGWTKRYAWYDNLAWESDFEKATVGGKDTTWVDTVDFAFFAGHGSTNAFWFGVPHDGNGVLPCRVDKSEVSWGETDLDWLAIFACNVLQYNSGSGTVFQRWGPAFKGLHQMLGFETISYDYSTVGSRFAYYMTRPWYYGGAKKIKDAWFQANRDIQPSNVWSAVLSTDRGWNDYLPGYGSQGADGGYWLYWQKVQA